MFKIFAPLFILGGFYGLYATHLFYLEAQKISAGFFQYVAVVIFALMSLVFFLWGLAWLFKRREVQSLDYKTGERLKTEGEKISAKIVYLQHITNVTVNQRSPYVIHAESTDPTSGQKQIFRSFWIWADPFVQVQNHPTIDVYLHKNNPKKYYMDLASIGLDPSHLEGGKLVFTGMILIPIIAMVVFGALLFYTVFVPQKGELEKCINRLYGKEAGKIFELIRQGKTELLTLEDKEQMFEQVRNCQTSISSYPARGGV